MENILGHSAQFAAMMVATFFALLICSGLANLYLRFHDRLPIDRDSVHTLIRNFGFALLLTALAAFFHFLPFFMALGFLLCGGVVFQLLKISGLIKKLEQS